MSNTIPASNDAYDNCPASAFGSKWSIRRRLKKRKSKLVELTYKQLHALPVEEQVEYVMKTRTWRNLRKKVIKYRGFICEDCRESFGVSLDLWHKTYDRIGCEHIDDVLLLCKGCSKRRQKRVAKGVQSAR